MLSQLSRDTVEASHLRHGDHDAPRSVQGAGEGTQRCPLQLSCEGGHRGVVGSCSGKEDEGGTRKSCM